ncbi:hypothetical protein QFZ86_000403 [Pseudomonas plecoglossicida]
MATIHVGKCRSLADIENAVSQMNSQTQDDRFVFPLDFFKARHSPIYDASRLQMVVTLARKRLKDGYLDIHPNASPEDAKNAVCSYSPGIAGVRLTRGIRLGDLVCDRRDVLKAAAEKMQDTDAGNFRDVIRGRALDLICVAASKVQYLRPLFSSAGIAKKHGEMRSSMDELVAFVNQQSRESVPDSLIDALGSFSSELIQNTQDHAVTDHAGTKYLSHVEGLILGWTRLSEDLFAEDFSGNDRLKNYWDAEAGETASGQTSLRVFEISYFDSGPGLVSRYTGKLVTEMTIEKEKDALLNCLRHNVSSKPQNAAGEGLPHVLAELSKIGGLIRIRSGRLSVFNVFSKGDTRRNHFEFEDWV